MFIAAQLRASVGTTGVEVWQDVQMKCPEAVGDTGSEPGVLRPREELGVGYEKTYECNYPQCYL